MIQHKEAYKFLCEEKDEEGLRMYEKPLTCEVIRRAHYILMEDGIETLFHPMTYGTYRNHSAHSGDHVYVSPEKVLDAVSEAVEKFNAAVKAKECPIKIAADLYYELITIHPFSDGNGRLCRLMLCFALFACGTPFPVSLTSGHSRSRDLCMSAIQRARHPSGDRTHLYTLVAASLQLAWSNYLTNLQYEL